ncbi:response regulator [Alkalinema pantanalense CENA528]|uniref:hybrid sensor histidine kinase/response regulator n=1 Tax=Alkalinema pantanalense TaxID=1620705 RepID=UPI003D6E016D
MTSSSLANILVVDDTPTNLRLLMTLLTQRGYTVRPAVSGKQAIAAAQGLPPDLILLDISMPEMDGYEVCRYFKADARTQDIPIIFLSAASDVLDKVKGFEVGGVDYITKPFQIEEVLARISTHLQLRSLQSQMQAQNVELSQALTELQTTQAQLIQNEKMAALGELVASVAHEMNSPLGVIRSSAKNVDQLLNQRLTTLPTCLQRLSAEQQSLFLNLLARSRENTPKVLQMSSREKRQWRRQIIPQLAEQNIDAAEEIADILVDMGILQDLPLFDPLLTDSNAMEILEQAYMLVGFQRSTKTILEAVDQAVTVVQALRRYAYHRDYTVPIEADVTEGIETSLTLHHNQMKHHVEVIRHYRPLPPLRCFPEELNQVWNNLIHNALQAMNYQGILSVTTKEVDRTIVVQITDSGPGVAPEIQDKIFEPFFTTKTSGKGNGLGLSIVKKIVDKHSGHITVTSQPGSTTFSVVLPLDATFDAGENGE